MVLALAHCQKRFEGQMPLYKYEENSGGLGCFTPDNFPVFDVFRENVYVIADSNHGYKMIGVGKLVAQELVGEKSSCLSRSGSRASPRANCIRPLTAHFLGAEAVSELAF